MHLFSNKCLVPFRSINSTVMTVLHVWLENFVRIGLGNPRRDGYSIPLPCTSNRLAVLKDRSVEDAVQGFAGGKGSCMSYVPPPEKFTQAMHIKLTSASQLAVHGPFHGRSEFL